MAKSEVVTVPISYAFPPTKTKSLQLPSMNLVPWTVMKPLVLTAAALDGAGAATGGRACACTADGICSENKQTAKPTINDRRLAT